MYVDALTLLSDAQAVTADAVSTNTIDLGASSPARQIGDGEPMAIGLTVDVAADHTTGDETYTFEVIQSAAANLGSPDILASYTIAAADLAAGSIHALPIPPGGPTKRYLGLNYNTGGTSPTITVTAWLTALSLISKLKNYAKNYAV